MALGGVTLVLVRHAESADNASSVLSARAPGPGLSDRGVTQARALADRLRATPIDSVWSSPLLRARLTADLIAADHATPVRVTDALAEYNLGCLEGCSTREGWLANDRLFADWMVRDLLGRAHEGGESGASVIKRVRTFLDDLARRPQSKSTHVLIGHGGSIRVALPRIATNVSPSFAHAHPLANTEAVELERRSGCWRCVRWGPHAFNRDGEAGL